MNQDLVRLSTNEDVLVNYVYSEVEDGAYFIEIDNAVTITDDGDESDFDLDAREEELKEALVQVIIGQSNDGEEYLEE